MEGLAEVYEIGLSRERELESVRRRFIESQQYRLADRKQRPEFPENLYRHKRQMMQEQEHTAVVSYEALTV